MISLLINGCGSSNHATATAGARPATGTSGSSQAPSTHTEASASPTRRSAQRAEGTSTSGPAATAGATNVRLPATFVITAHGSLTPSTVAAPSGVTIQLTVTSADGHAHQVVVRTVPPRSLAVPAGGRAATELTGLKVGRYEVEVDGARAGAVVVGAQPGP